MARVPALERTRNQLKDLLEGKAPPMGAAWCGRRRYPSRMRRSKRKRPTRSGVVTTSAASRAMAIMAATG